MKQKGSISIFMLLLLSLIIFVLVSLISPKKSGFAFNDDPFSSTEEATSLPVVSETGQFSNVYLPLVMKQKESSPPQPPVSVQPVGAEGITFTAVLTDPTNPAIVYAGSFGTKNIGTIKSTDGGTNWLTINNGFTGVPNIQSLALINKSPNIIFAGTYGDGLYRSDDAGQHWIKVNGEFNGHIIYEIEVDQKDPSYVYLSTRSKSTGLKGYLYRSTDGGRVFTALPDTWSQHLYYNPDYSYDVTVDPIANNKVWVTFHQNGYLRSSDFGMNFAKYSNGIGMPFPGRAVAYDPANGTDQNMYGSSDKYPTIYRSFNGGINWTPAPVCNWNLSATEILLVPAGQAWQKVLIATQQDGVWYSDNRGEAWSRMALAGRMVNDLAVTPSGKIFAAVQAGGLYSSLSTEDPWRLQSMGSSAATVNGFAADIKTAKALPSVYAAYYGLGIQVSNDGGLSWAEDNAGLNDLNVLSLEVADGTFYALTETGIYQKKNMQWEYLPLPRSTTANLQSLASDIAYKNNSREENVLEKLQDEPDGQKLQDSAISEPVQEITIFNGVMFAGTSQSGLWSWNEKNWTFQGFDREEISDIAAKPNGEYLVIGHCLPEKDCGVALHDGKTTKDISTGLDGRRVNQFYFGLYGLLAATDQGVFSYDEMSSSWYPVFGADMDFKVITASLQNPDYLVATAIGSAWYSSDAGKSWDPITGLDESLEYRSAIFDPADPKVILLGTRNSGAYRVELP